MNNQDNNQLSVSAMLRILNNLLKKGLSTGELSPQEMLNLSQELGQISEGDTNAIRSMYNRYVKKKKEESTTESQTR